MERERERKGRRRRRGKGEGKGEIFVEKRNLPTPPPGALLQTTPATGVHFPIVVCLYAGTLLCGLETSLIRDILFATKRRQLKTLITAAKGTDGAAAKGRERDTHTQEVEAAISQNGLFGVCAVAVRAALPLLLLLLLHFFFRGGIPLSRSPVKMEISLLLLFFFLFFLLRATPSVP